MSNLTAQLNAEETAAYIAARFPNQAAQTETPKPQTVQPVTAPAQPKKQPTQTDFINNAGHIPAQLIRAVIRQLGGFEYFQEQAPDITNHGIDGGFSGFIYHAETVAFAKKHKKTILQLAEDQARDYGDADAFTMIAGFNCLKGLDITPGKIATLIYGREPSDDDGSADYTSLFNALAWYAGEEVARAWCDYLEQLND
jgi:hypothetical protein